MVNSVEHGVVTVGVMDVFCVCDLLCL